MRTASLTNDPPLVDVSRIDLADTALYTKGDPHLVWRVLRQRYPVFWNPRRAGGFWAVTRHADVRWVLRDYEVFTSERGTALDMIGVPDPAAGKMMHATDPPRHRCMRTSLEQPLLAREMRGNAGVVRALVSDALAPARIAGDWDAASALARLPVRVMVRLMDLPASDVEPLLRAAYGSVAPLDQHYRSGSACETLQRAHSTIVEYFTNAIRDRRRSPARDLLSHMITADVGGRRLTEEELVVNCFSFLVGGVVTTAQAASATLIALTEHVERGVRWPTHWGLPGLVEEAMRWASPTVHFLRYANRDVTLHGVRIRAGEPVAAWIAAANRDEAVFYRPDVFDPNRRPNRHVSFGSGPHRCVGRHLARLMLTEVFRQLGATVASLALAGEPVHLESNLIAGVVSLPLRVALHR